MEQIEIAPGQLQAAAGDFHAASRETRKIIERLDKTARGLEEQWSGAPQQVFYQQYLQWRELMSGMVALLKNVGHELEAISERFADLDG